MDSAGYKNVFDIYGQIIISGIVNEQHYFDQHQEKIKIELKNSEI